jgi:two-component system response regulator HydG
MKVKILIVEDEFIEANYLRTVLERAEYFVCSIARSVHAALKIITEESPNLVLLDIHLHGDKTGIDLAKDLREMDMAFVYISANSNKQTLDAAKATKPYGFLVKPFREKDVLVMLDIAWYLHEQNQHVAKRRASRTSEITQPVPVNGIIGNSVEMTEVINNIQLVGPSDSSVLLLGDSGTGKELIAKAIHESSNRRDHPLVVVNCGALPANLIESELFGHEKGAFTGALNKRIGKFELADQGTIFLDEVGELPLDLQVKFLRVLQEREIEPIGGVCKKVNLRIIAATNRELDEEIAAGRFRLDLYYRLNVFPILLPPLRQRGNDILLLADYFLSHYAAKAGKDVKGFSSNVSKELLNYSWPGNVRELENLMERSILLAKGHIIDQIKLPLSTDIIKNLGIKKTSTIEENERNHIVSVIDRCKGKISGAGGAAEVLDINVSTLNSRMKKLGIKF